MENAPRLAAEQNRVLGRVTELLGTRTFYLAGGTAVALHLGHRVSRDLELFSRAPNANLALAQRRLVEGFPRAEVVAATDVALELRVGGVAVDVVRYPHAPLEVPRPGPGGFPVAGLRDLAAMKLGAIAGRGLRRDFWDLYAILQGGLTLEDAARAYVKRFGRSEADLYHVARALTYFADANADRVRPQGLTPALWRRIQRFFEAEAPTLLGGA